MAKIKARSVVADQIELFSREKREVEPDFWHIPDFLDLADQQLLVDMCRAAAQQVGMKQLPTGRFYPNSAPVLTQGRYASWGGQFSLTAGYSPAILPIPELVQRLSNKAVLVTLTRFMPYMADPEKFCGLIEYYAPEMSLGMHSDDKEPPMLIYDGAPVVRLCLGDTAAMNYQHPNRKRGQLEIRSGDAIVFGGQARLLEYSIGKGVDGTAPAHLMRKPGRIDVSVRQCWVL